MTLILIIFDIHSRSKFILFSSDKLSINLKYIKF